MQHSWWAAAVLGSIAMTFGLRAFGDCSAATTSGKPALVQSTGCEWKFADQKGLLTFRNLEEAIGGLKAIENDYPTHCHAARQLAEAHFDSSKVLSFVMAHVGL